MCEQLKRRRSAYCRGDSCRLLSLNYHDVEELRQISGSIDRAVSKAISSLKNNRPNLFAEDGATADSASRHVHEPGNQEVAFANLGRTAQHQKPTRRQNAGRNNVLGHRAGVIKQRTKAEGW